MSYRACIFDLDGTLADTLASIAGFVNDTLRAFGLPEIETDAYRFLVGNGADLLLRRALAKVGAAFSEEEIREFRAEYDRRYEAEPLRDVSAYPGLPELLRELHEDGVKLGVLSNKPDNMTRCVAGALYPGLLDEVRGQRDDTPQKPYPTAVLAVARELGAPPARTLYIGDSGVDMDAACNAGLDSCGVLWGFRGREELLEHGAVYLAADASELREIIVTR